MNVVSVMKKLAVTGIVLALAVGVAWAGGQGGATLAGVPVFVVVVAAAFAIQWLAYIPAQLLHTERFFDATGSLTYLVITVALLTGLPDQGPRALALGVAVIVWAGRLGTFLFLRIRTSGSDSRFDAIKRSPLRFFNVWTLQGLWVTITASAAWIAMTSTTQAPLTFSFFAGAALWAAGFVIEVTADAQKSRFRADPSQRKAFITTGLWSWSQHPNYFGEIVMWIGVALVALPNLAGWQLVGLLSPVFVIVLLTRISGIPLLQRKAQATWGEDPAFQEYRRRTSLLIPMPPGVVSKAG